MWQNETTARQKEKKGLHERGQGKRQGRQAWQHKEAKGMGTEECMCLVQACVKEGRKEERIRGLRLQSGLSVATAHQSRSSCARASARALCFLIYFIFDGYS